jgi:hypothetical protein
MKKYEYIHIKLPVNDNRDSSITKEDYNQFLDYIKDHYGRGDGRSFAMFIKDFLRSENVK